MKKSRSILVALALVVALSCAAALVACNYEGTWDETADNQEGALELYQSFFEDTLKDTNQIVNVKFKMGAEDEATTIETIDGTTSYLTNDGIERYAFIQDGKYMAALKDEYGATYREDKEGYDMYRYEYAFVINIINAMDQDATYLCNVKGESKGTISKDSSTEESTATLTLTVTKGEETLTVNATAKNGLIESFSYTHTYYDEDFAEKITDTASLAFTYGTAHIELPDMSDWERLGE